MQPKAENEHIAYTGHEAAYAVALQRYIVAQAEKQQRVTVLAAVSIASLAVRMGIMLGNDLAALGFRINGRYVEGLAGRHMLDAAAAVRKERCTHLRQGLSEQFEHMSVDEVQGLNSRRS